MNGGRRLPGWLNVRIGRHVLLGERQVPGIDHHREIRPATQLVGGIDGIIQALVKMRTQRCGQVSARGKPEHPNPVRVDSPFGRMFANQPNCALRILQAPRATWDKALNRARDTSAARRSLPPS